MDIRESIVVAEFLMEAGLHPASVKDSEEQVFLVATVRGRHYPGAVKYHGRGRWSAHQGVWARGTESLGEALQLIRSEYGINAGERREDMA